MTRREQIRAEYAPLINAAAQRDAAARSGKEVKRAAAFLDVPFDVCGILLRPMTVVDYVALIVSENAHVVATVAPATGAEEMKFWAAHNMAFLWAMSYDYKPGSEAARSAFIAKHAHQSFDAISEGIVDYLVETFGESKRGRARGDNALAPADLVGASFVAHWQHRLSSAYGWSREQFRQLPLKELFQIFRVLDAEDMAKAGKEPHAQLEGEADRMWAEMLQRVNEVPPDAPAI